MTPQDLKSLRSRLGLTQKELAEEMGVSERQAWRWESGESPIPKPVAKLLSIMLRAFEARGPS